VHKIQRVTYRGIAADLVVIGEHVPHYYCQRDGLPNATLGYRTVRQAVEAYEAEVDWLLAPSATLPKSREVAYA